MAENEPRSDYTTGVSNLSTVVLKSGVAFSSSAQTIGAQPRAGFARFDFGRRAFRLVGCSALGATALPESENIA